MARSNLLPFLAVAVILAAAAASGQEVDEKDVVVLTTKNFDETLSKHKFALVEFYAPWCGHCKSLKPEYAAAATAVRARDPEVVIAKVDATEEGELAQRFGVRGYPTIKWFVDGKDAGTYESGRSADAIASWVKKKSGPATSELAAVEALEELLGLASGIPFLVHHAPEDAASVPLPRAARAALDAVARATEGLDFYTTSDAEVAAKLGLGGAGESGAPLPAFALVRNYAGHGVEKALSAGHEAFKGLAEAVTAAGDRLASGDESAVESVQEAVVASLEAFLEAEKLPAFLEFKRDNTNLIFAPTVEKQIIVAAPAELLAADAPLVAALRKAGEALRGSRTVQVVSSLDATEAKPLLDYFGVPADSRDAVIVGYDAKQQAKYKFPEGGEGTVTAELLVAFAKSLADGTAERMTKSAPEPAEPLENGVAVVVGTSFDRIVKDPTKDVLLEIYAPWCGHCKQLVPTYEKVAKRFSTVDSVVIAKMDGTVNEHADVAVRGYPTLLFFPAGAAPDAEPITYEGERTYPALVKFIKKNAVSKFTLPKKKGKKKGEAAEAEHEEL